MRSTSIWPCAGLSGTSYATPDGYCSASLCSPISPEQDREHQRLQPCPPEETVFRHLHSNGSKRHQAA
jgi:hypothetical protein